MVTKSISLFGRELVRVERNRAGEFSYTFLDGGNDFINGDKYLQMSLENPVLMTVCTVIARLYSQMRITHVDSNGKPIEKSEVIKLLQQPNYFQSQEDWLFQQEWFKSAAGTCLIYQKKAFANDLPKALYNLIPSEIDLNKAHKVNKFIFTKQDKKAFDERLIKYTLDDKTYELRVGDLIPLYDLSNAMIDNSFFISPSRVKGVHKVLQNIDANLASKHKNLQMSAKYLSKNQSTGNEAQIQDNDRTAIEKVFSSKDLLVTNTSLTVQHLVSDMKRLYLDEQFADDANKVLLAYELNKNVLNYFAKDSTFENQTEGVISFIQNNIQVKADNLMHSLSSSFGLFEQGQKLVASYDHLATMQPVVNKKITSFKEMQEAIKVGLENQTLTTQEAKKMSDEFKLKLGL